MTVEGTRKDAGATGTAPTQPNERTVVMVVKPADVGLHQVKPAGPPRRVGQGF